MNLLNNVSEFFYKKNNLTVLLISVLVFMVFINFVLPVVAENSKAATGASVSPDQSFFYTASDLYTMAELYGEEGRRYYIINRFTFDIIWPFVYGAFLVSALTLLLKRKPEGSFLRKMNLLPVGTVLLDFMENIGASIVMFRFPQKTPVIEEITPIFTMSKWIAIGMAFLLLFILLGQWLISLIQSRITS